MRAFNADATLTPGNAGTLDLLNRGEIAMGAVWADMFYTWQADGRLSLLDLLKADPDVAAALSTAELEEKFDLDYHLRHVDTIFARVFGG